MSNTILTGEAVADILAAMQRAGLNNWEMLVPEGVEEIASGAFAGMKSLRRVQLPKTLRKIGAAAFYGCESLTQITLPAGLLEIETAAFKSSGLQEVSIPPRVAKLGSEVFADSALRCAEIKGRQTGASMFRGCRRLTKIQLNDNIRKIEAGMLRDCTSLKMLRLPEKLERIGTEAFAGCGALERLGIPAGVREIGAGAFRGCAFETVHVPEAVEELRWEMFSECRTLRSVYIPAGVRCIEADVFYGCNELKNVCFGADLTTLQSIRIGEGNEALSRAVLRCGIPNKTF